MCTSKAMPMVKASLPIVDPNLNFFPLSLSCTYLVCISSSIYIYHNRIMFTLPDPHITAPINASMNVHLIFAHLSS